MNGRLAVAVALWIVATVSSARAQDLAPAQSPPADSVRSETGLAWTVVKQPTGETSPGPNDFVTLDYTGWTAASEVMDSTAKHPDLRTFMLSKLFPGLQESIATMKTGEKRRIWIPAALAPKKAPVVFDVELLEISKPLVAPPDVAAAPANAARSKSGLAWLVLKPPTGTQKPKGSSFVVVHYTGWTTDGKMFDSSLQTGKPASFSLDAVIPGWTEGLRMMSPGERRRFWIPARLAYQGARGKPRGLLVFDVELLRIN
ncbi:MAG TPA: FKBP-type peptidyl-prolyl cis-trans isomerase [Thermoanaerobaculia bacterium]|nr:FKBP-type peptidyl-prolyl cis-trans isomerase [Thermoanaerobaculia bacterium]